jgi:hypothetical protein
MPHRTRSGSSPQVKDSHSTALPLTRNGFYSQQRFVVFVEIIRTALMTSPLQSVFDDFAVLDDNGQRLIWGTKQVDIFQWIPIYQ